MTANDNLSYGDYGYNRSGCTDNYSNSTDTAYLADSYSTINSCGDGGLVNKQPCSSRNLFAMDVIKAMWRSFQLLFSTSNY